MNIAQIYCRFSPRRDAAKSESNETQAEQCQAYCLTQGLTVGGIHKDNALSGDDADRPALWNAIDALKKGDVLVIYRLDRMARSVYLTCIIEQEVEKKKARIVSVCGEGNGGTHEDKMMRGLLAVLNEYYKKVNAARTKAAMIRHQKSGRRMGRADRLPFGWKLSGDIGGDCKRMERDQGESAIIGQIVVLRAGGASLGGICKQLPPCRVKWTPKLVMEILKREKL